MAKIPKRINPQTNLGDFFTEIEPRNPPRNWSTYNQTQTNEKLLFLQLLSELLDAYIEEPKTTYGRKPISMRDMIFCCCYVKYANLSSRRGVSELKLLQKQGYIEQAPHFNTVLNYFKDKRIRLILKQLILIAGLPLAQFEDVVAVDASGFGTSLYSKWLSVREHAGKRKDYRKVHISTGVKTNVVTAIEVSEGARHDSPYFEGLVRITSSNFSIKQVLADMGYTSKTNMNVADELGIVPLIPFKKNATGRARGSLMWKKMYAYYTEHYDEFMKYYHLRSNVESTFSMVKRKFGTRVRTKNGVSQDNEILCIFLCHNIVQVIKAVFDFGLFPDFEKMCKKADCTLIS